MIRSMGLTNFQSHEDTVLDLHNGVNAIVGSSDSGKTAILRALYWVIYNRPLGDAHVSHWNRTKKGTIKDETAVVLDIGGLYIRRERTEKFNGYRLLGNEEHPLEEKTLEAIRAEVPEEITAALGMTEVNVQRQMDAPFLLSESPPEVARFFNRTIHLDLIDTLLTAAESKRRGIQRDQKQTKASLETLTDQIEGFGWVEKAERLVKKAGNVTIRLVEARNNHAYLQNTFLEHGEYQSTARRFRKGLKKADAAMTEAEVLTTDIQLDRNRNRILFSLHELHQKNIIILNPLTKLPAIDRSIKEVTELERSIEKQSKVRNDLNLLALNHLVSTNALKEIGDIQATIKKVEDMESISYGLRQNRTTRRFLASSFEEYENKQGTIISMTEMIETLTNSLPDVCPTCGQPIEKEHAHV